MKKILFILFVICGSQSTNAQPSHINIVKDTVVIARTTSFIHVNEHIPAVVLSNGSVVYEGEYIPLGKGTLPNGDFNYIATASNTMEAKLKFSTILKSIRLIEIKKKGGKKYGYKYFFIAEGGHLIQLEDAIATGEVVLPAVNTLANASAYK
jgi:hypothetical protein